MFTCDDNFLERIYGGVDEVAEELVVEDYA
jgi:hypothetical protein